MLTEPTIDMEAFRKDWVDGMSAYNLQSKYLLTPRQYRRLVRDKKKTDGCELTRKNRTHKYVCRSYFNEPYISKTGTGYYIVRKNETYYGQYKTLEIARKVKMKLIECDWDKTQINKIRKELGIKPMRSYNDE